MKPELRLLSPTRLMTPPRTLHKTYALSTTLKILPTLSPRPLLSKTLLRLLLPKTPLRQLSSATWIPSKLPLVLLRRMKLRGLQTLPRCTTLHSTDYCMFHTKTCSAYLHARSHRTRPMFGHR